MPTAIYVASPEGDTGKSAIALGILHRLAATVAKVGVFRPITRLGEDRDYILELLLEHATAGLPYERCVGVTYQQLHADVYLEGEIAAWYDATSSDEAKTIARRLNRLAVEHVLYAPLGVMLQHHAWRKNVSGIVQAPLPLFWGVSKTV